MFGESVYALTVRGRFNGKAGDFEAGRQDLQRAIELAPWEDAPYHRLAHLERSAGSWDAALAAAELALAINPNDHYTSLVQKARKTVAQARVWEEHQARLWTDPAYTLSYFLDRLYANAISSTAVVLGLWALSHSGGSGHSSSPPGTSISTSSSRARPSNNGPPGASFI